MSELPDFPRLLAKPESRTLEFERDAGSLRPILRSLVAFANTAGGTVVLGRDDDGTVVGLDDAAGAEARLASAINDGIRPGLLPDLHVAHHEGMALLLVRVPHLPGPFHVVGDGPQEGIFVRLGSSNRRADASQRAELVRLAQAVAFDRQPCLGAGVDDLDLETAREAFARRGRELDQGKLLGLGLLVRHGEQVLPSNAAMILFGREAARLGHFPNSEVRCARFVGVDRTEFLDRYDVEGTPLDALRLVPAFVRRNTRLAGRVRGMVRNDLPEYPTQALREGLVNAIAHSDYSLRGSQIRVAIYSDRLEVENPGTLPFGTTLDDLKAGISTIRNPVIARVLRELGHMEEWGSGYRRIEADCRASGHPLPAWQELSTVTRIVFHAHPDVIGAEQGLNAWSPAPEAGEGADEGASEGANEGVTARDPGLFAGLNPRQQWVLRTIAEGNRLRSGAIVREFGVSQATADRDLAGLRERGLVRFEGAAKTGSYVLAGEASRRE